MSKKDRGELALKIMKKEQKQQLCELERLERVRRNPEAYGNRS